MFLICNDTEFGAATPIGKIDMLILLIGSLNKFDKRGALDYS
jgi:hypothetical protein